MNHPFLHRIKYYYLYLGVWILFAGVHALFITLYYHISYISSGTDGLVSSIIFADLAIGVWYIVRFINIDHQSILSVILNHLAIAALMLLIWVGISYYLLQLILSSDAMYLQFLNETIVHRVFTGVIYYIVIILIYYLYIYYSSYKENFEKKAELASLVKDTQLALLKFQLNPHFIFNSLNSISSLTLTNPNKAQEMVVKLSSFLRYALDHESNSLIRLEEELNCAMLYLDIEKVRFGERLQTEIIKEENCDKAKLPNMLLQPLIENALKHGVYESTEPVVIRMHFRMEENVLKISVQNSYTTEQSSTKRKKGIGLNNIRERLYLIYNRGDLMTIQNIEQQFIVTILLPQ